MKTWVRKTLSIGVLAAGALLLAPSAAQADGIQDTGGNLGLLNGTQVYAPVNAPVNLCGNSLGLLGLAQSQAACFNGGSQDRRESLHQDSAGNAGVANGTQVYSPISAPLTIAGNAIGLAGVADAAGAARNESGRGDRDHSQRSHHNRGLGNGSQFGAPINIPINVCGNSLALLGGAHSAAFCGNDVDFRGDRGRGRGHDWDGRGGRGLHGLHGDRGLRGDWDYDGIGGLDGDWDDDYYVDGDDDGAGYGHGHKGHVKGDGCGDDQGKGHGKGNGKGDKDKDDKNKGDKNKGHGKGNGKGDKDKDDKGNGKGNGKGDKDDEPYGKPGRGESAPTETTAVGSAAESLKVLSPLGH